MSLEVAVGIISVILLLWWLVSPPARLLKLGNKIPGPPAYPLVGNTLNWRFSGPNTFRQLAEAKKTYGPVFRLWLGSKLVVSLTDPTDIQMVLTRNDLITKSTFYKSLNDWVGNGLFLNTGDQWYARRKAITPTFHFKILDEFLQVFNECGSTLVNILKKKTETGSFDLTPYTSACALDVISKTAMGYDVQAQGNSNSAYRSAVERMTKLICHKIDYPWRGAEPFYSLSGQKEKEKECLEILHELPRRVLKERREEYASRTEESAKSDEFGIKKRRAFLELLLDISKEKNAAFETDRDITEEVETFMFAGHDTTATALAFTTWALGKNPEIQEKLYNEVSSVVGNSDDITMEQLNQMKFLERVIKESLRMYPPLPIYARYFEKDVVLPSGHTIPAGSEVQIVIALLHRDPKYFDDPETFNPDRFLNDLKHPYSYLPFSAGPRNCIGMRFAMTDLKTLLAKLVMNFEIKSDGELTLTYQILLRSENGAKVKLSQRKNIES